MRIVYSREAVGDLARLREFIAVHNPAAAQKIAVNLLKGIERLRQFPLQGFEVPLALLLAVRGQILVCRR